MGFLKLFSGIARIFKRHEPKLVVTKIKFASQININYAIYPQGREPYIKIPAGLIRAAKPPYADFRKSKPDPTENHWEKEVANDDTKHSWPVALIRRGGNQYAQWTADVTVKLNGLYTGDINVKASCQTMADDGSAHDETLKVPETKITFNNEDEKTVNVSFDGIPDTVRHMGMLGLFWEYKTNSMSDYKAANLSLHCVLVTNAKPLTLVAKTPQMNYLKPHDYFLFDIFDWSCKWADGMATIDAIEAAIWNLFHPFDPPDDNTNKLFKSTGLFYWTTASLKAAGQSIHKSDELYQTLPEALWGKYDPNDAKRSSASCIVFDRIFLGTMGVQGIPCQEIRIMPNGANKKVHFPYKGEYYQAGDSWRSDNIHGHANPNASPIWSSHWIAFAYKGDSNNVPLVKPGLFDPSYGGAKIANVAKAVDAMDTYERGEVTHYRAKAKSTGNYRWVKRDEITRNDMCLVPTILSALT
jgi:hypothetical protein